MTVRTGVTTAGTTTTDVTSQRPAAPAAGQRPRPQWLRSVRTRIVVTIMVLTSLAMLGAGVVVYALESDRIDQRARAQIEQEVAELRELSHDPLTGERFRDVQRLLEVFLSRNVPDDDEMLVGYAEGDATLRTRNRHGEDVLEDPAYRSELERLIEDGGFGTLQHDRYGEIWLTVVPMQTQDAAGRTTDSGALALVTFLDDEHEELNRTMTTYAVVAFVSVLLIALIAAFQSGRLLAPLRRLRETAEEITETGLDRRIPESGNDDITALTRTINGMLDRLESAFVGQRQFLDDAGHELKTPLTVLRGHLELVDPTDTADVAATRELLLEEVDRMGRLVGDLILLAKSRRPDFVTLEEVDLADLTETVLAKARALGDREWVLDEAPRETVSLDQQRITQAMLQLADNAVKHTDVGDTVAVGSAVEADVVRLWVRDSGDGIPPADREAVLERFARSRVRSGDEGFGLGLSIVAAIADAHGGGVRIEDARPSPGVHVEIRVPRRGEHTWPRS